MKKIISVILFLSINAFGSDDIDVKIDWVMNVAKSTVLEVCGSATSKTAKWPLVVSITHGSSTFSTITGIDGKYCQLLSRQTFKGEVKVRATSMDGQSFGYGVYNLK